MPIENGTVYWRQFLKFCDLHRLSSIKKDQK